MFYVSIIIIQAILFEAHFLLYETFEDVLKLHGEILFVLKIILGILSLSFIGMSVLARLYYNKFTRFMYTIMALWFGFLIYFLLAALIYWIFVFVGGKEISQVTLSFAGTLFFSAAIFVGIFGTVNARNIRVTKITVAIENLPKKWISKKAVLVSDVHLGQIRGEKFSKKISEIINNISPDVVFFVGDLFDGLKIDIEKSLAPFKEIKAPLGIFFVSGNHEEYGDDSGKKYFDAMKNIGIKVLENEKVIIDDLEIIGVSDSDATDKIIYEKILSSLVTEEKVSPRILLKHTPVLTKIAIKYKIDLELSGHTHGGQVFPFNMITPLIFKDRNYGLSKSGGLTMYTSSGVGTWVPPMRIGTNPEIVLISFENKS